MVVMSEIREESVALEENMEGDKGKDGDETLVLQDKGERMDKIEKGRDDGRPSPSKRKRKGAGKKWKRQARKQVGLEDRERRDGVEAQTGGRKRGGSDVEEEDQNPLKKISRTLLDMAETNEQTAELALQLCLQQ